MTIRTIKNIDEATWRKFKSTAAKQGMKMGTLFKNMVENYSEENNDFWKDMINRESTLSTKEANELKNNIITQRKEYGFRK